MSEVMYSPDILQTSQAQETRNAIRQYISYLKAFKKCDFVRRKILYIFSELGKPVKTARLIKMSSNKTQSEIRTSKGLSDAILV